MNVHESIKYNRERPCNLNKKGIHGTYEGVISHHLIFPLQLSEHFINNLEWGFCVRTLSYCQCTSCLRTSPYCTFIFQVEESKRVKMSTNTQIVASHLQHTCVSSLGLHVVLLGVKKYTLTTADVLFQFVQSEWARIIAEHGYWKTVFKKNIW